MSYRTDIEKALDEMISNEEGMRFQGLAVILAKLKWPEFIASERHNDLGLDAHAPASRANDNDEKGLVCSLTATIDKIKGDIERFQPHYPNVKVLIFARDLHDQQSRYLLQRCLCLLPFLDLPLMGIARIKEIITAKQISVYDLREILNALGNSRCDEALDFLLEFPSKYGNGLNHIRSEWIDAIAVIDTDKSRKILMSFVDPEIEGLRDEDLRFDYHENDGLSSHIADIACKKPTIRGRLFLLCDRQPSSRSRMLLANVISKLGTSESIRAGLNLIDDRKNPSIPYQLLRGLEDVFIGKRPYGSTGYTYTIESTSANEIRSLLYEMAIGDAVRKRSVCVLLGQIESWRLEYGRPDNEPRHPAFDAGKPWPLIEPRDNFSLSIVAKVQK